MSERIEALVRIFVGIVSGLILGMWGIIAVLVVFLHWLYVLIFGKRNTKAAEMSHNWVHEVYRFNRYLSFHTNKRPFPFTTMDINGRKKFEK